MRKMLRVLCLAILLLYQFGLFAQDRPVNYIFKNGKEGYKMYRIPTLIKTQSGKLLAFCEGRQSLFDNGHINMVMKTSADEGKTWSALKVIWTDGKNTCGNPCPVVDEQSGDIVLLGTWNNRQVKLMRSADAGEHWTEPKDITDSIKSTDWQWYATGPVHGIQLKSGQYKGRIVIPCNHTMTGAKGHISHVVYSDDHGYTWHRGGSTCGNTDECTTAELNNGELILNMRSYDRTLPKRKISHSIDGGATWSACAYDTALTEPICQGALLCYTPATVLFTNPAHHKSRKQLSLSVSYDDCRTWTRKILLHHGPSAYSDMSVLSNGNVVCIYECGKIWPYGGIAMQIIESAKILR